MIRPICPSGTKEVKGRQSPVHVFRNGGWPWRPDEELLEVCRRLWNNIVYKRMYITGAVGSQVFGESFTFDYDLPNDTSTGKPVQP